MDYCFKKRGLYVYFSTRSCLLTCLAHLSVESALICVVGKHAPGEVEILPLDLAGGEDSLREAVERAESLFSAAGVDYMIHNAAYERPVSEETV